MKRFPAKLLEKFPVDLLVFFFGGTPGVNPRGTPEKLLERFPEYRLLQFPVETFSKELQEQLPDQFMDNFLEELLQQFPENS